MNQTLHILLIEDSVSDAMLIKRTLIKELPGCIVFCVDTRGDYIKALEDFCPDVILSDYTLPGYDGMSALKTAIELAPDVPFLIVTGSINEETAAECIKAGAWDYVLKDHMTRLGTAVRSALEQKKIRIERRQALQDLHESEERFRTIYNLAPVCIAIYSEDKLQMINPAGLKLFGAASEEELINRPYSDLLGPGTRAKAWERASRLHMGEQGIYPAEEVFLRLDGTPVEVEIMASLLHYKDKPAIQLIINDITQRKKAEQEQRRLQEALYQEKEYLDSLIKNASNPIVIWTPEFIITEFNNAFEEMTGYRREEIIGKKIDQTLTASKNEMIMKSVIETKEGKTWHNREIRLTDKRGKVWNVLWSSANIADSKGNHIATIVQGTDITERKKAEEYNLYLSYHDHLTDLYNRRYFENQLNQVSDESELPVTVIIGDINGLKLINDSFGHEAGDDILKKAAAVLVKGSREKDIVARLGGDEFGIILKNTDGAEAENIINKIKAEASIIDFNNSLLSISFGYATMQSLNQKMHEVITEAENFMYKHKMYESASMRNRTIDVIMNALYEKSDRELRHSQRVSNISAKIAEKLNFGADEVNKIRMAGLIHDIGKIGISEKILNKPASLDEDEWALIKKHPEAGWRILSSDKEFSELARSILHHHEKYDGTGYPKGLKGEQIPIESRIIAVADAYDAMTSKRAYRNALTREEVLSQLTRNSGKQFDPHIIDVFINSVLINFGDT